MFPMLLAVGEGARPGLGDRWSLAELEVVLTIPAPVAAIKAPFGWTCVFDDAAVLGGGFPNALTAPSNAAFCEPVVPVLANEVVRDIGAGPVMGEEWPAVRPHNHRQRSSEPMAG